MAEPTVAYVSQSDIALLRQVLAPFPSGPAVLARIEAVVEENERLRKVMRRRAES